MIELLYIHALNWALKYTLILSLPCCLVKTKHESYCFTICFKLFPAFCFCRKIYLFLFALIYERLNLCAILSGCFPTFSCFNAAVIAYWKQLSSLFWDLFYFFFFSIQENLIYDPPKFKLIFLYLYYNPSTSLKAKSVPFNDSSKPIWFIW